MARTVSVKLLADVSQYVSGLKRGADATKEFTGKLDQAAKAGRLDAVADQATRFGLAGVAAFGLVVKSAADFDKQMSAVSAATHANAKDMANLRAAALAAGKDTQFSATQAAEGITELSKAGVSTADVLGGGLKGALALAAAGQISVAEAAETSASALTQFKLKGDQVPHVADLLAAAAGKAQGSVHDMGYALNQSGLVASQFGLSIEDTTGALAEFANAGLIGSDAGTSFKTMLLAMANPTIQSRNLMNDLGLSFYDAQGKFIGVAGVAQVLQTKLKGLTQEQRNQALGQIFGNDAIRAASILYTDGAKGVEKWRGAVNDAGYASDTASKLTDNLAGDLERLKGSLETMAIQSGSGANGGLRILVKSLGALVDEFGHLPSAVGSGLTVLAGVGATSTLALAGFLKLRKGLADAVEQLSAIGPAGEKAAGKLQTVASAAGKVAVVFAALEVVGAIADQFKSASANTDKLSQSLVNLEQTGHSAGESTRLFGADMKDFATQAGLASSASHGFVGGLNDVLSSIPGVGSAVDALNEHLQGGSFNKAKASMASLDDALVNFMNTTNDARKSSELWNQLLLKSGMDTDEFASLLPGAYKKLGELNVAAMQGTGAMTNNAAATGDAATATKKYTTAADAAAGAAKGEAGALAALNTQLKAQVDPVFALLDAEGGLTRAQKEAAAAVKQHGRNSDEAKEATRRLAVAALDLQGKAGALAGTFDGKMTPAMRTTLKAAHLTDQQIEDVAGQFRKAKTDGDKYAKTYNAGVTLTGAAPVAKKLEGLSQIQQALAKGVKIPINPTTFFHGLAAGGPVAGPGTATSDSIPAMLSDGEYVVKASSAANIGVDRLNHINRTGELPTFAGGGHVTWPYRTTAGMTRVPSRAEVEAAVIPPVPSGGQTSDWIVRTVHAAFPGLAVYSKDRPGARTLTGNTSYHALGRAVDFAPSRALAEWINAHYFKATRELITPWQSLNIRNGARHQYSALIENQHSGSNAHDHWAMANGGVIREPVYGIGASGDTYSFGEGYRPETVIPGVHGGGDINVTVQAGYVVSEQDLENKIARTIDRLRAKGRA